jgi:hypothetical protein
VFRFHVVLVRKMVRVGEAVVGAVRGQQFK